MLSLPSCPSPVFRTRRYLPLAVGVLVGLMACARLAAAEPAPANGAVEPPKAVPGTIENSVVKVFSTMRYPDPFRPWTKQAPTEFTGSGVVIEGKRILTNAHVVLYASQVQVQGNQAGDKISATIEFIAPAIDLAVLKLDDDSFFDTHAPLTRADTLPDVKDSVLAYGFPTGGTTQSITKASCRELNSPTTTTPSPACASRSMPPSIPATAAVRRLPATE